MEQWKTFYEYDNLRGHQVYQVSTSGKIRNATTGKIRRGYISNCGYYMFILRSQGIQKLVHRIVAETFIPNPTNKPVVDHIDGNPLNNHVENLRWVSQEENMNNPVCISKMRRSWGGVHPYKPTKLTLLLEKIVPL